MSLSLELSPDGAPPVGLTTRLDGVPIAADDDFFVRAPPEIGEVVGAFTDLTRGARPSAPWLRLVAPALGFAVGFGGCLPIVAAVTGPRDSWARAVVPLVPALAGLLVGWSWAQFVHHCVYVGARGVVEYTCSGSRSAVGVSRSAMFADATALYTSATRVYKDGKYAGTRFSFELEQAGGAPTLRLFGSHDDLNPATLSRSARLRQRDWYVGVALEAAFIEYFLPRMIQVVESGDRVTFPVSSGAGAIESVAIRAGALELTTSRGTLTLTRAELPKVSMVDGRLTFGRSDDLGLVYSDIANGKLFLLLLERFVLGVE